MVRHSIINYVAGVLLFLLVYWAFTPEAKRNEFGIACDSIGVCFSRAREKCGGGGFKILKAIKLGTPNLIVIDCDVEGDGGEW